MAESLQLEIIDVAFGGAGIARHEGKVYFVPFTAPGDVVRVRVKKDKKKFAEAELEEVVTPSPSRVAPPCPYFGRCGGCAYQHIAYEAQLELKSRQVEQTLRRVGRIDEVPMQPIVPSPRQFGFRNRIRVHVVDGRTGFFAHRSHSLIPISRCEIAEPAVNEALNALRRNVTRDGDYTLTGGDGGRFFEQTNRDVAAAMLALAAHSTQPGQRLLVDAYCGAGFFAQHLATKFERVIGIEENEHAVHHARETAGDNETYICGDVGQALGEVLSANDMKSTTVLLDPPAAGLSQRVVDLLQGCPPAEILYVSCDPATMARDLAQLVRTHRLISVTPLDMFPQTSEIETMAVLRLL